MRLREFAPAGGGGSGNYFQALASAWYNGVFDTGSLPRGIKTQEDVERLLNRGIVCPDGKTRKLHIDYNSDFDGVEIYSDDYYEYGDHDDTIDSRTGEKWGPYDFMAFSDEQLDEDVAEAKKKKKKKSSRSLRGYFFPGYAYYGSGESGEGGGDGGGGGESINRGVAEGSKYKCTCHPGDADPDCPVHGLEPMEVGDALDVKLDEKSTSQAQFRTMAAAAHNPEFAKKVGIKQSVAREFNRADKGQSYKSLPKKAD